MPVKVTTLWWLGPAQVAERSRRSSPNQGADVLVVEGGPR